VAGCAWVIRRNGLTLADIGERLGNPTRTLVIAGLALAAIAALKIASRMQKREPGPEQLRKATANVRRLLPATG
jgi:hypothetical protein